MQPDLRAAICRVEVGGSVGTGALVAPGVVLTALHVVADRQPQVTPIPGTITLSFPERAVVGTLLPDRWDASADWALIAVDPALTARPIPLADAPGSGLSWETHGFPEAQPVDGMVIGGRISNHAGRYYEIPALQLYSDEAAAAGGMPVRGLSGAPVLVDGALVGVLRASLLKEGKNVAGTLYACPSRLAAQAASDLLPWPDPCAGLPGLPAAAYARLPAQPFRSLLPYGPGEAALLAGRCREIRALLGLISGPGAPVLVIHGPAGVGKSSLLQGGLLSRLGASARYARRSPNGLLADLRGLLGCGAGDEISAWKAAEQAGPLSLLLDQVEEAWTHPQGDHDEVGDLLATLGPALCGTDGPRGRLILALRKEWEPDLRERLRGWQGLGWETYGLTRLDRASAQEVVGWLEREPALQARYRLSVEPGLPARIADDLLSDPDSPVAPLLQILLTRLWEGASPDADGRRHFTVEAWQTLRREGIYLDDFLKRQLGELERRLPTAVASGLALDLLAFHVGAQLSSVSRSREDLAARYGAGRAAEIGALCTAARELYLLADAGDHGSRLAHDTLAPVVRTAFDRSTAPGQRASALLEGLARVPDASLDASELRLLDQGASGMRAWTPEESARVEGARATIRRDARLRLLGAVVAGGLVLGLLALLAVNLREGERREAAEARAGAARAQVAWQRSRHAREEGDPWAAIAAIREALSASNADDPMRPTYAAGLLDAALAGPVRALREEPAAGGAAFSPDGRWMATVRQGEARVWEGLWGGAPRLAGRRIGQVGAGINPLATPLWSEESDRLFLGRGLGEPLLACAAPGLDPCSDAGVLPDEDGAALAIAAYDDIASGKFERAAVNGDHELLYRAGLVLGVDRSARHIVGIWEVKRPSRLMSLSPDAAWFATWRDDPGQGAKAVEVWSGAPVAEPTTASAGTSPMPRSTLACGDPSVHLSLLDYQSFEIRGPEGARAFGPWGQQAWPAALLVASACQQAGGVEFQGEDVLFRLPAGALHVGAAGIAVDRAGEDGGSPVQIPSIDAGWAVLSMALDPGLELVAVGNGSIESQDLTTGDVRPPGSVELYSARSGDRVAGPWWAPTPVVGIRFTEDGGRILATLEDGTTLAWPARLQDPASADLLVSVFGACDEASDDSGAKLVSCPAAAGLATLQAFQDPAVQAVFRHLDDPRAWRGGAARP